MFQQQPIMKVFPPETETEEFFLFVRINDNTHTGDVLYKLLYFYVSQS